MKDTAENLKCTECLHYISFYEDIDRDITRPACSMNPEVFISFDLARARTYAFWYKKEI